MSCGFLCTEPEQGQAPHAAGFVLITIVSGMLLSSILAYVSHFLSFTITQCFLEAVPIQCLHKMFLIDSAENTIVPSFFLYFNAV